MPINIKYNNDGSVTVECGSESVVIPPRSPPTAPLPDPRNPLPRPRTGPRLMIVTPESIKLNKYGRIPTILTLKDIREKHILADTRMKLYDTPRIDVRVTPEEAIDVHDFNASLQQFKMNEVLDVYLWMVPDELDE